MENLKENSSLLLTAYCFKVLLAAILQQFESTYPDPGTSVITQLYGFGNYNSTLPNLKQELEQLTGGFINGKYLYDKNRELQSGKPIIKLNGFYKVVLFQYIGYKNVLAFTKKAIKDPQERKKQLELITTDTSSKTYYYVGYYFGEYKEIIKSQVLVLNDWKNIEYKYLYPQEEGSFKEFLYFGTVKKRADILHIRTRTLLDGKMVEGGENILYIGYGDPSRSTFILGVFSAFDINNRVIAGKLIQEKCASKEEMIQKSLERKIPAYIAQELRNVRIENDAIIPNHQLEISSKSPYSITYEKIPGNYHFKLYQQKKLLGNFAFSIDANTYKITPTTSGVLINKDHFELLQNGSVIHFSFQLMGIALFSKLELFFKTYYLNRGEQHIQGVFSGLDIENRLICGKVLMTYEGDEE